MKSIYKYFIYSIVDIIQLMVFLKLAYLKFLNGETAMFSVWFILFVMNLNEMVTKGRNFRKYYPHFEDKWLYMF